MKMEFNTNGSTGGKVRNFSLSGWGEGGANLTQSFRFFFSKNIILRSSFLPESF